MYAYSILHWHPLLPLCSQKEESCIEPYLCAVKPMLRLIQLGQMGPLHCCLRPAAENSDPQGITDKPVALADCLLKVSLLHEVILLYTKPHCTRTAVCTMQSTEGSLTVLVMSRLYCIFFCAYVLKFCVLILILAARELKSSAAGEER